MHPKSQALIMLLTNKTKGGEIHWRSTSCDNQFALDLQQNQIIIDSSEQRNLAMYSFIILDVAGNTIDKITEIDPNDSFASYEDFNLLAELYESVRRNALHVDKTIDSIFLELGE